jgi:hypothetical protein
MPIVDVPKKGTKVAGTRGTSRRSVETTAGAYAHYAYAFTTSTDLSCSGQHLMVCAITRSSQHLMVCAITRSSQHLMVCAITRSSQHLMVCAISSPS